MGKRKNKSFSVKGFEPSANAYMSKAFQELRRSNAASPHILKKDKGTRSVKNKNAIKDFY